MTTVHRFALVAAAVALVASHDARTGVVQAQTGSAKAVLEQYNLLGIFAADCTQPASEQNPYVVHRAIDEQRVQRDTMTDPSTRADASVIDRATAEGPNEIIMSMANESRRLNVRLRVDRNRWRLWESVHENGQRLVSGGRVEGAGAEMPWLGKCVTP